MPIARIVLPKSYSQIRVSALHDTGQEVGIRGYFSVKSRDRWLRPELETALPSPGSVPVGASRLLFGIKRAERAGAPEQEHTVDRG